MIKKSLAIQEENSHEEIKEVESDAEHSDHQSESDLMIKTQEPKISKPVETAPAEEEENRVSVHIGSVEEYLGNKVLFEQGQIQVDSYKFFCNIYIRRFKLDHIRNYKDFHKILELEVISRNHKLYEGKDFPTDFIQQLERSKKELTKFISY